MNKVGTLPVGPEPRISPGLLAEPPSPERLTRVALAFVEGCMNVYIRFGVASGEIIQDRWRRCALFVAGARFCRVRWEANEHGTTRWQLMVLQAGSASERLHRIAGIAPGAELLLRAEGERQVRQVLAQIDAIEALGIDATMVASTYWRTLHNRMHARQPLPTYTIERHVAHLASGELR